MTALIIIIAAIWLAIAVLAFCPFVMAGRCAREEEEEVSREGR